MTMNVKQKTVIGWTAGLSIVYAITRYHFFKGVPFQQFFPEILNKGLSLAAILLISLSLSVGPLSRQFPDKFNNLLLIKRLFGLWGFVFAFLHSLVSIHFYKPDHYPKFFSLEHLNVLGKFVLYFGVVSLILLSIAFMVSFPKKTKCTSYYFPTIPVYRFRRLNYWGCSCDSYRCTGMVSSLLLAGIFNSYYINFIYSCFDNYYLPNFI